MLSPRPRFGLIWGVGWRLLWVPDPPRRGWHTLGVTLHPLARRDGAPLRVSLGRCWALNENMAYWWIIRIPILLASLVGGHPPAPCLFREHQLSSCSRSWVGRAATPRAAPSTAQEGAVGLQGIVLNAHGFWVGGGFFCTSLLTPRLRGSVLSVREGAGGSPCCFLAGILGWQEGRKGSSGDPALMGCSSLGSTRGCHLLQPPRVRIVARVGCEGRGCWAMCAPALSLPPDQPADLHADPQGDPGQTPC